MTDIVRTLERALADRYVVEGRIGSGATAVVLLARDKRHDRQVALKVLRPDFAETLGTDRFLREIRLVASFTHPHILPLHDSGENEGLLWYSMPLARGGSLRTRLSMERPLPIAEAVRITLQTAAALAYAHGKGVVHRDIKPENILLEDGEVLLTDFGLARSPTSDLHGAPGMAVGTPMYMSPEQAVGLPGDGRSDVYALACVLYEMLDGEPPFSGRTAQVVLARHRTEPPRDITRQRPAVSLALKAVLERALAKQPAQRYDTAAAFAEALRSAAAPEIAGDLAARTAPLRARGPWWRRPETLVTAGVAVVLAVGLAIGGEGRRRAAQRAAGAEPLRFASAAEDPRAVLVQPMRTAAPGLDAVAELFTDALVARLGTIAQLRVARAGVQQVGGLDVQAMLAQVGDSVRVTLQVRSTADGRLWREVVLSEPAGELPQLQEAVTQRLADEVRRAVGLALRAEMARRFTDSDPAWEQLMLARAVLRQRPRTIDDDRLGAATPRWTEADSLLERASAFDPDWAEPWLDRARIRLQQAEAPLRLGFAGAPTADSLLREAGAFTDRALRSAGDSAAALTLRGRILMMRATERGDTAALVPAEAALMLATTMRREDAAGWAALSDFFQRTGRLPESAVAARQAYEADAFLEEAVPLLGRLVEAALDDERWDEAARWCDELRRRFAPPPPASACGLAIAARRAAGDSAIQAAWREDALLAAGDTLPEAASARALRRLWVAAVLARTGLADSARRTALAGVTPLPPADRDALAVDEAALELQLGSPDAAVRRLRAYLARRPGAGPFLARHPLLRSLRDDPAFRRLVATPRG